MEILKENSIGISIEGLGYNLDIKIIPFDKVTYRSNAHYHLTLTVRLIGDNRIFDSKLTDIVGLLFYLAHVYTTIKFRFGIKEELSRSNQIKVYEKKRFKHFKEYANRLSEQIEYPFTTLSYISSAFSKNIPYKKIDFKHMTHYDINCSIMVITNDDLLKNRLKRWFNFKTSMTTLPTNGNWKEKQKKRCYRLNLRSIFLHKSKWIKEQKEREIKNNPDIYAKSIFEGLNIHSEEVKKAINRIIQRNRKNKSFVYAKWLIRKVIAYFIRISRKNKLDLSKVEKILSKLKSSLYKTHSVYGIFYTESVLKFLRFKKSGIKSDSSNDFFVGFFKAFSTKKQHSKKSPITLTLKESIA